MATLTGVIASRFVIASLFVIASEAKQSTTGSHRRCAPRDDSHNCHCEQSEAIFAMTSNFQ